LQHWSVVVIEPTVGRIVWYRPSLNDSDSMAIHGGQPMAATVAFVVSNECVNLSVTDHDGHTHSRKSVTLHQGEGDCDSSPYCEWMPYQKGQAAKTEQFEAAARAANV
jgi:hypothetical protein